MKQELTIALKAITYTVIGYFIATTIERKLLSKSIVAPLEAPTKE